MPRNPEELDPYAPPPRHKERSGPMVRIVLIAAMLGLAYWGYTEYSDQSAPALVAEEQTQQLASNPDGSYAVTQSPETAAPATAPAAPAPDTPPPSTTIGSPGR